MSAGTNPADSASGSDDSLDDDRATATPDEDGPHDVPDDKVIEATLPAGSTPRSGEDRGPR